MISTDDGRKSSAIGHILLSSEFEVSNHSHVLVIDGFSAFAAIGLDGGNVASLAASTVDARIEDVPVIV